MKATITQIACFESRTALKTMRKSTALSVNRSKP
jgi:hypothetical protein